MVKRIGVATESARIRSWGSGAVSLLLATCFLATPGLGQDRSAKKEVKRQLRDANDALARSDLEAARPLFGNLEEQVPKGDERRAVVLYGVAQTHALGTSDAEDLATARSALEELAALPAAPHPVERNALVQLLDALESLAAQQAETASLKGDAAALKSRLAALEERQNRSEAEAAAGAGERGELENQLTAANETIAVLSLELTTTRAELANKEKTLEQLRQKLVGDG